MVELGNREIFDEEAFRRVKLGVAILMTAVGVPLIWMGEEFGEYKPKQPESSKIDWTLLGNDLNRSLFESYKGLTNLRKSSHALYTENIEMCIRDRGRVTIKKRSGCLESLSIIA